MTDYCLNWCRSSILDPLDALATRLNFRPLQVSSCLLRSLSIAVLMGSRCGVREGCIWCVDLTLRCPFVVLNVIFLRYSNCLTNAAQGMLDIARVARGEIPLAARGRMVLCIGRSVALVFQLESSDHGFSFDGYTWKTDTSDCSPSSLLPSGESTGEGLLMSAEREMPSGKRPHVPVWLNLTPYIRARRNPITLSPHHPIVSLHTPSFPSPPPLWALSLRGWMCWACGCWG